MPQCADGPGRVWVGVEQKSVPPPLYVDATRRNVVRASGLRGNGTREKCRLYKYTGASYSNCKVVGDVSHTGASVRHYITKTISINML